MRQNVAGLAISVFSAVAAAHNGRMKRLPNLNSEQSPQQLLHWIHGISVVGQLATYAAVFGLLHLSLPWAWLLTGTALLALWGGALHPAKGFSWPQRK